MADVVTWVGDQLYEILGLSDRYTAEFLVGLAKKSSSLDGFVSQLESTGTLTIDHKTRAFASELWGRVPHKAVVEKPARAKEREAKLQTQRNKSYQILYDSGDEEEEAIMKKRRSSLSSGKGIIILLLLFIFLVHIGVLMLHVCRKFELLPSNNF